MSTAAMSTEPDTTTIDSQHLSITQEWASGGVRNIHLMHNPDLPVLLERLRGAVTSGPLTVGDNGVVVISLGVDEDHDEVQFSFANTLGSEEVIAQAREALEACADALKRLRRA